MKQREAAHILAAIIVLIVTAGFYFALKGEWLTVASVCIFSAIIICVNILVKKWVAWMFDADVEHEFLFFQTYGVYPGWKLKKKVPFGIIVPLFFSLITLGVFKVMTLLTYETRIRKTRAAKRHGFYSFTEMTDESNGLIGAAGIAALIILAIVVYLIPNAGLEYLSKMSIYYAFWNLIPFSKLDGTQIFFGSKTIWTTLAVITAILTAVAILI